MPRLDHAEIIRLRQSNPNMCQREIAQSVGGSLRQVQRILVGEFGPEMRPGRPFTDEETRRILSLLEDGCPYAEVARTVNRHPNVLSRKFPGYGVGSKNSRAIGHMMNQFERLIERLGMADAGHMAR